MPAYQWVFHGEATFPFWGGFRGFESYYFYQPPLYEIAVGVVYRILGFGIWQTRLTCLLFYALSISMTYVVGRAARLGKGAAVVAAILAAIDPLMVWSGRSARMDSMYVFFVLCGVCLILRETITMSGLRMAAAGSCFGLAGLTHPLGGIYAAPIALWMLIDVARRRKPFGPWLLFCGGVAVPLIPWAIQITANLEGFQKQFFLHVQLGEEIERDLGLAIFKAFENAPWLGYRFVPHILVLYGTSYVATLLRLGKGLKGRGIFLLVVPLVFGWTAMSMKKYVTETPYYYVGLVPFLAVMAASFMQKAYERLGAGPRLGRALVIAFALLAMATAGITVGIRFVYLAVAQGEGRDAERFTQEVGRHLRPGAHVLGPVEIWYAVGQVRGTLAHLREQIAFRGDSIDFRDYDYIVLGGVGAYRLTCESPLRDEPHRALCDFLASQTKLAHIRLGLERVPWIPRYSQVEFFYDATIFKVDHPAATVSPP